MFAAQGPANNRSADTRSSAGLAGMGIAPLPGPATGRDQRLPSAAPIQRSIPIHCGKLTYSESGAGDPVVLLHSSASSGAQWRAPQRALSRDYRAIAPDLYGYGGTSPWPGHRALTLADEAALVQQVMARYPDPVHLVGHSYGGAVALRVAQHRPERLRSLTLIEPVAFQLLRDGEDDDHKLLGEVGEVGATVCEGVATGDTWGGMACFIDYWNGVGAWSRTRFETRAAIGRLASKVAQDFHAVFRDPIPLEAYAWMRVPTLVLRGEVSPAPTRRVAQLLSETLPNARMDTIGGAGHMLPLSHGDAVGAAIMAHLSEHGAMRACAA